MNEQSTPRRNQDQFRRWNHINGQQKRTGTKTKQDRPTTRSADSVYKHAIRAAPLSLRLHHIHLVVLGVWQPPLPMIFIFSSAGR